MQSFVPLHVKSQHSIGLGTASIPALLQHAGRAGFAQLGLTDLENVYGHVQFHAACRVAGLKPISGVELRVGFQARSSLGQRAGRLVLLAADARGYASIERRDEGAALRVGLALIARLRATTRERILAARAANALASGADLLGAVRPDARELRALIESGAADELLGLDADDFPWVHDRVRERLERGDVSGLAAAISGAREQRPREPPELVDRYRRLCRVQRELEHLGMHVSEHPSSILRNDAERQGCVPSHRLCEHDGELVKFAGIIAATRRVPTASAAVAQYITLEDEHGLVEAHLSPAAYETWHAMITTPGPYLVEARVHEQQGAVYLAVERLLPFHERPNPI